MTYADIRPVNDLLARHNTPHAFLVSSIRSRLLFVFNVSNKRIGAWMKPSVIANLVALIFKVLTSAVLNSITVHIATRNMVGMIFAAVGETNQETRCLKYLRALCAWCLSQSSKDHDLVNVLSLEIFQQGVVNADVGTFLRFSRSERNCWIDFSILC